MLRKLLELLPTISKRKWKDREKFWRSHVHQSRPTDYYYTTEHYYAVGKWSHYVEYDHPYLN